MKVNGIELWQPGFIVGARWDRSSTSSALTKIDKKGNTVTKWPYGLNQHPLWGGMRRCTMTAAGLATYGSNARGDGLTLDGSTGRVMVEIPKFYVKVEHPSANVWEWYLSPAYLPGYEIHPAFVQSHDASLKGLIKDNIYVGAYEASLKYKALADNTIQFDSRYEEDATSTACTQPVTGGSAAIPCLFDGSYTGGNREFVVGETLTNNTEDAKVHDWTLTGGSFGAGTAAGHVLMQVHNDPWGGGNWAAGNIADSDTNVIATSGGAPTHLSLNMANCRTYSETNIGGRWGFMNVWTLAAIQMLYIVEYANFYSQDSTYGIGPGITGIAGGTGYNGRYCGADNADTNVGTNGTGTGDGGTADETPVVYRGIENPWGNTWTYTDGYNAINASYNIVKADGSGTFADTLTAGNYDASSMAPTNTDGYVTKLEFDDLMKYFMISDGTAGGSSATYLTDYFYAHDAGETNILLAGGTWSSGAVAGFASLRSYDVAANSNRSFGSRPEFM